MYKKIGLFTGLTVFTYAENSTLAGQGDILWMWVALFAMGIIGIAILFFSSKQISKIQAMHKDVFKKQLEMEKNQALILTKMSEDIQSMTKEILNKSNETKEVVKPDSKVENDESSKMKDELLCITNDLINFLKLKSKKVQIINEEFNLNNVFNEVSGLLSSHFKGSNVELIFDIDNSVPRLMRGDSLHLGQILTNILESRLTTLSNEELKLDINMFNTFDDKFELQFQLIDNGQGMTQDEVENLFIPYYDEENNQYVGLGLFVAKHLISMMHGELSIHSKIGKGTSFTFTIPFNTIDSVNKRKYRLPNKILTDKKVFIVDSNYNAALAIEKMFSYFKHDVRVISKEIFVNSIPNLTPYDIVVIDNKLLSVKLVRYIEKIKREKELKVVSLYSILNENNNIHADDIIDKRMFKPLNQERIFEMITSMYELNTNHLDDENDYANRLKIHRTDIIEATNINQDSFNVFSGKRLLIVEDNIVNQKVLLNILKKSGMHIIVSNNGAEGIRQLKRAKAKDDIFDLVLMDINMPVMDGFSATKEIRDWNKFDTLPIVAFTALVLDSEIEKMFNLGMNAYLSKPINIGKLYTAMSMFLLDKQVHSKLVKSKKQISHNTNHNITGLNIENGISHSNNSEALYAEILSEFIEAYGPSDIIFANLVNEHRYEQLKMLCLDMRGLSGTIGATDMYQKIDEVQKLLIYNKYELLVDYIDIYKDELAKLTKGIALYLSKN